MMKTVLWSRSSCDMLTLTPRGGRDLGLNGMVMRERPCACDRSPRGGERSRWRGGVGDLQFQSIDDGSKCLHRQTGVRTSAY